MPKIITLENSKDLRIAKNLLIISVLFLIMDSGLALLFELGPSVSYWFDLILKVLFFASNIAGVYQLSKVARSSVLFKNYTILVVGTVLIFLVFGILIKFIGTQTFDLKEIGTSSNLSKEQTFFIFILGLRSLLFLGLFVYCANLICKELTSLSGDDFFVKGFKAFVFSLIALILGDLMILLHMGGLGKGVSYLGLIGVLVAFFLIASGIFRLKQITCITPKN